MTPSAAALILSLLAGALAPPSPGAGADPLPKLSLVLSPGAVTVSGAIESGAVEVLTGAAASLGEPSAVLIRLKPGVTVAQMLAFLARNRTGDPSTIKPYGSIVFDRQALPGGSSEAQTVLSTGTYLALNAEGERSSRWPAASFTVPAGAAPRRLPAPAAVERTRGFALLGPRTLRRGELVRFENDGPGAHMDIAFRTRTRTAAERLATALRKGHQRTAERLVAGGPANFAGVLSPGGEQQERITSAPGWYVQTSFAESRGRLDTRLGMERVIRILR